MARKSTNASQFKSEAEEADWYVTTEGRRQTQREFARALREGTLARSPGLRITKSDPKVLEQLLEQAKESATRPISIRIPVSDLEHAKRIAEETGVGYQTVLKQAIREGLKKDG
jgi:histidinol phosphatase-like enzyme